MTNVFNDTGSWQVARKWKLLHIDCGRASCYVKQMNLPVFIEVKVAHTPSLSSSISKYLSLRNSHT